MDKSVWLHWPIMKRHKKCDYSFTQKPVRLQLLSVFAAIITTLLDPAGRHVDSVNVINHKISC